jgi:hypothetical protein
LHQTSFGTTKTKKSSEQGSAGSYSSVIRRWRAGLPFCMPSFHHSLVPDSIPRPDELLPWGLSRKPASQLKMIVQNILVTQCCPYLLHSGVHTCVLRSKFC